MLPSTVTGGGDAWDSIANFAIISCHFGLASAPHAAHSLDDDSAGATSLKWTTLSPSSSTSSDLTVNKPGEALELLVAGTVVIAPLAVEDVDPRWLMTAVVSWVALTLAKSVMCALRSVPVKEVSACL